MSLDDGPGQCGEPAEEGLDPVGWLIATLHELIGHDRAAAVLGQPPGTREGCLICAYERDRTEDARQKVIRALAPGPRTLDGS